MNLTGSKRTNEVEANGTKADELKKEANRAFNQHKFSEAIATYTRILEMSGLSSSFQVGLSYGYLTGYYNSLTVIMLSLFITKGPPSMFLN
jgi:hypothetical protein